VNNFPITLFDIDTAEKELHISRQKAVKLLIQNALESSEIHRLGLKASDEEIDIFISKIMSQNRIPTKLQFFQKLEYQGISKSDFLENVKQQILKPKLYQRIASSEMVVPTKEELKDFYKNNISQFKTYENFDVAIYTGTLSDLENKKITPLKYFPNIQMENKILDFKTLNPQIKSLLAQTLVGTFSTITQFGNSYVMFFVNAKNGEKNLSFDEVENIIKNQMFAKQQQSIIERHFKKIEAKAVIEYLR
jgi:parvulin-like peptidyl-prolyl isomerase